LKYVQDNYCFTPQVQDMFKMSKLFDPNLLLLYNAIIHYLFFTVFATISSLPAETQLQEI